MATIKRIDPARRGAARFYEIDEETRLPSVTSILQAVAKPALVAWAANKERELLVEASCDLYEDLPQAGGKMSRIAYRDTLLKRLPIVKAHQAELEKAAKTGTELHSMAEWTMRKERGEIVPAAPVLHGEAAYAFAQFEDWRQGVHLKPIFVEQVVYSREWGYAGTEDVFAEFACPNCGVNVETVVDWKTSSGFWAEMDLQNAAYVAAMMEMGHTKGNVVPHGLLVRFAKTKTGPPFEVRILEPDGHSERFRAFVCALEVWRFLQAADAVRMKAKGVAA